MKQKPFVSFFSLSS